MQSHQYIRSFLATLLFTLTFPALILANSPVATDGGLQVGSTDDPYWFNISGVLKLDERAFKGNKQVTASGYNNIGQYIGEAFIRDAGLTLEGGVGKDYGYTFAIQFDTKTGNAEIDDAFITYYGFKDLMPNFSFSVGQVIPGFCLACADSSKWIPFMERSMGTNTFGPRQGLGVSANSYDDHYSATVAVTKQPKSGGSVYSVSNAKVAAHDQFQASGRFTYAPISETGKVLQFGVSAHIQEYANYGLRFRTYPEMKTNTSTSLLDTAAYTSSSTSTLIAAKNQKTVDFELLGIHGPWSGELEYQRAYVARGSVNGVKQGANLTFSGYHAQVSYILTGETRPLKKSNGTLGRIKPNGKHGAWEVSARYSFISLNDKDINGGRANNTSASVCWYANNNIKVIGEYVFSLQRRHFPTYFDKRHVSGIGARLQVVF